MPPAPSRPWWYPFTEANTYGGLGVFLSSIGVGLIPLGFPKTGGIIALVGGAFTALMFYISREGSPPPPPIK